MSSTQLGPVQHAVVGDGFGALLAVAMLRSEGVLWIKGSGARLVPPLSSLGATGGAILLERAAARLGIDGVENPRRGCFVREFKNKALQLPPWTQVPAEMRADAEDDLLWAPELAWVNTSDSLRYSRTLPELDEMIRARLASDPGVLQTDLPLRSIELGDRIRLGIAAADAQGSEAIEPQVVEVRSVIYADRIEELRALDAKELLKLDTVKNVRESKVSVLQWMTSHSPGLPGAAESVCVSPPREEKEALGRRLWGSVLDGGRRSLWTMALSPEEFEDHNDIAKKLRKIRHSIDKIFSESFVDQMEKSPLQFGDEVVRVEQDLILDDPRDLTDWEPVVWEKETARFVWLREAGGVERSLEQLAKLGWSEAVSLDRLPTTAEPASQASESGAGSESGEPEAK